MQYFIFITLKVGATEKRTSYRIVHPKNHLLKKKKKIYVYVHKVKKNTLLRQEVNFDNPENFGCPEPADGNGYQILISQGKIHELKKKIFLEVYKAFYFVTIIS